LSALESIPCEAQLREAHSEQQDEQDQRHQAAVDTFRHILIGRVLQPPSPVRSIVRADERPLPEPPNEGID
jgi:hypothetical protein